LIYRVVYLPKCFQYFRESPFEPFYQRDDNLRLSAWNDDGQRRHFGSQKESNEMELTSALGFLGDSNLTLSSGALQAQHNGPPNRVPHVSVTMDDTSPDDFTEIFSSSKDSYNQSGLHNHSDDRSGRQDVALTPLSGNTYASSSGSMVSLSSQSPKVLGSSTSTRFERFLFKSKSNVGLSNIPRAHYICCVPATSHH